MELLITYYVQNQQEVNMMFCSNFQHLNKTYKVISIGGKKARYVGRGTIPGYFQPISQFSASLGQGWDMKHLVTNGVALCLISHGTAASES